MRSLFNDLSIRSKLILMVAGAVITLTSAVLMVVWKQAEQEVTSDISSELKESRDSFISMEAEHIHDHVQRAEIVTQDSQVLEYLHQHDVDGACRFLQSFLPPTGAVKEPAGHENLEFDEDAYDVAALVYADGHPLVVAHPGGHCVPGSSKHKWRVVPGTAGVTNWENTNGLVSQIVMAPVHRGEAVVGAFALGQQISDPLAAHIKEHTRKDVVLWHMDDGVPHLLAASRPGLKELLEGPLKIHHDSPQFDINNGEFSVMDVSGTSSGDILGHADGLKMAIVESKAEKMKPFRKLQLILAGLAGCTLLLGILIGVFLSQPIASPLMSLANAADSVAKGQLDVVENLLHQYPTRLQARDEVGVLGRSFMEMVRGLKERLAMTSFLSEATHDLIRNNPDSPAATRRTNLVVVFSDVRQFSKFSETRDPQVVINTINRVLGIQAEIVRKHGGDIDKYVGDAMVAWFNGVNRCQNAVAAATEAIERLWSEFGGEPGTCVGFGIHAGEVVLGCVGSQQRRDYTAIGSTVNLAARLCSAATEHQILVSERVQDELAGAVPLSPPRPMRFKGFSDPLAVYEVQIQIEKRIRGPRSTAESAALPPSEAE